MRAFTRLTGLVTGATGKAFAALPGSRRRPGVHRTRSAKAFYGWWIVTAAMIINSCKHGTFNRGISFYVLPLTKEMSVGVAAISVADVLGRVTGGIVGPFMGYLTDRFGARIMLIAGGVASGIGLILLSFVNSYRVFLLVFVGLISMGFRTGYDNAASTALNQWFRRRRALAMSFSSVGQGLGGVAITPLVGLLVLKLGWRTAAKVSGIGVLAIVLPLAMLVRRSPESMGLLPDGDRPDARTSPGPAAQPGSLRGQSATAGRTRIGRAGAVLPPDPDFTAKEAMWTWSYWLLVLAVGFRNTVHSGVSFLMVPVLVWFLEGSGRSEEDGMTIAIPLVTMLAFCTIVFNPLIGWLGDSWSKLKLSAVTMVSGVLALLVLMDQSGHIWQAVLFVVLMAFSESSNALAWAILGDFFGRRSFATLRGWQHLPNQCMSAASPWWMGLIFDHSGSYVWALIPLAALYGLAGIMFLIIPVPTPPVRSLAAT